MKKVLPILMLGLVSKVTAQIPVEFFGGHERTTLDIMFFKYFKTNNGENSCWLFFNRNRASIDYRMTESTYLPQFGFTEALSYNHKKLRGFAPVVVGQLLNEGVFPKTGFQYAYVNVNLTIFTWIVCELLQKPDLDYFLLFRFTPNLNDQIKIFSQFESINIFPTVSTDHYRFTQRIRVGIQLGTFQFGTGLDLNQSTNPIYRSFSNAGAFIRHEF